MNTNYNNPFLLFIALLYTFVPKNASSQEVTQIEAMRAATTLVKHEVKSNFTIDSISVVYNKMENQNPLLYEVVFVDGSAVLLSGHKACTPILGMIPAKQGKTPGNLFSLSDSIPDALKNLLDAYSDVVSYCYNEQEPPSFQSTWNAFQQFENISNISNNKEKGVSPLIDTKWGQSSSNDGYSFAYNYLIPICDNQPYCSAGCAAVAMAQILRYWSDPVEIPTLCEQYDWNNMPDELLYRNNPNFETERYAISKLIYDCGQSINTSYCGDTCETTSSGANPYNVPVALKTFGYNEAVYSQKNNYNNTWETMLRNSLDEDIPLLYCGYRANHAGHAFVCDGYKKRLLASGYKYHFNWGWRGEKDGWFIIDSITSNNHLIDYYYNQGAVFGFIPTTYCWQDLIMKCNKTFPSGTEKNYSTSGNFRNNYYCFVINSNTSVHIQAEKEILLTNGFHSANGSEFQAQIIPCGNSMREGNEREKAYVETTSEENLQQIVEDIEMRSISSPSKYVIIYPNPVNESLCIRMNNPNDIGKKIEIRNPQGYILYSKFMLTNQDELDVSTLPKGLYMICVFGDTGNVYYEKFTKE